MNPERITQNDEKLDNDIFYDKGFLCQKKILARLRKKKICINLFYYENKLTFSIYVSDQKFENSMDLLLVIDENKSHHVYIKDFDRFLFHKTKDEKKKILLQKLLTKFQY